MNNSFCAVIWRFIVCPFRVSAEKPLSVSVTHLLSQELGDAWGPRRLLEQSPATEPTGGCMSTPAASDKGLPGEPGGGQLTWACEDDTTLDQEARRAGRERGPWWSVHLLGTSYGDTHPSSHPHPSVCQRGGAHTSWERALGTQHPSNRPHPSAHPPQRICTLRKCRSYSCLRRGQ